MNGAAMNCQQEQALLPQHNDSSRLHSPGYLLQTNYPSQEQNSQHQYSKAMNYQLLSDNLSVDGSSKYSQHIESSINDNKNRYSGSGDIWHRRINLTSYVREPLELPVPEFEVDENSVGVFTYKKDNISIIKDSKDLDLDTRIDLLIKSKALSGMHPIFSELNDSEDSNSDSEESFSDFRLKSNSKPKHANFSQIAAKDDLVLQESVDDPEKPLSRAPSPFLSRATYLFWFNKAIEIKQQAKAQEKALLEKATKKLSQGHLSNNKVAKTNNCKKESNILLKNLLAEVSKELKEIIKQEFIKEIVENTAFNSLEDWWLEQKSIEKELFSKEDILFSSTTDTGFHLKDEDKINESLNLHSTTKEELPKVQGSMSPKVPLLSKENENIQFIEKETMLTNDVTSVIESSSTPIIKTSKTHISEEFKSENELELCKVVSVETNNFNDNYFVDSIESELFDKDKLKDIKSNDDLNSERLDLNDSNISNSKISEESSNNNHIKDITNTLETLVTSIERENQHIPVERLEESTINILNDKALFEIEQDTSVKNLEILQTKTTDEPANFEKN